MRRTLGPQAVPDSTLRALPVTASNKSKALACPRVHPLADDAMLVMPLHDSESHLLPPSNQAVPRDSATAFEDRLSATVKREAEAYETDQPLSPRPVQPSQALPAQHPRASYFPCASFIDASSFLLLIPVGHPITLIGTAQVDSWAHTLRWAMSEAIMTESDKRHAVESAAPLMARLSS